jgi:primosomal protein N' (replication factor Y)
MVEAMAAGEFDILIATQAAAKGHNFPLLTLVGVIDADLVLRGGDLRAGERTYQLLAQVTGRAGGTSGRAGPAADLRPEHPVLQAIKARTATPSSRPRWPSARPPACRRSAAWRR